MSAGVRARPLYRASRYLLRVIFIYFFRGRVYHRERVPATGGALLVCNHQSYLDPPLAALALQRECSFMARDTLFNNARFKKLIETYNAFPIKRGAADLRAIKETLRRLKAGDAVVTFPEATRSADGRLQKMQAGAVLLARKARVPVVPTLILGAYQAWPRQAKLPRPRPIIVAYAQPISPAQLDEWDDEQILGEIRRRIEALWQRYAPLLARRGGW